MSTNYHESVMVKEVVCALHIEKARKYIDATAGNGGHILSIMEHGGSVLGIDFDPKMIEIADERLRGKGDFKLVHGNFVNIDAIAKENNWLPVSGVIFDLGVSNIHLKDENRGFSFASKQAELDMRINPESQGVKAADLLNILREDQLAEMFSVTLEPGAARWITKRVMDAREQSRFQNVGQMLEVCRGLRTGKESLNEATLPFLALRIAVNGELDSLKEVLPKAYRLLEEGGRLVVITFHSGEDRIVKDFFAGRGEIIKPSDEELSENKRARSAKMRVLTK